MLSSEYIDYYALLNLPPHATVDEIRRAYRKKVMDCHPDLYPDNPEKLRLFNTVKEAYETLVNPQKKEIYLQERWRRKAAGESMRGSVFSSVEYLKQCLALNRQLAAMDAYRISEQQIFQQLNQLLAKEKITALQDVKDPLLLRSVAEALVPCTRFLSLKCFLKIAEALMQLSGDDALMHQKINMLIVEKKRERRLSLWKIPLILLLTILLCILIYFSNSVS